MITGSLSSMLPTTDLDFRGRRSILSLSPSLLTSGISSPKVTPGSHIATRLLRSTTMTFFMPLISTMTAPPTLGTVSPRKCGGPELTGTSGVFVSLARWTILRTSSVFLGRATNAGRTGLTKLISFEYSSKSARSRLAPKAIIVSNADASLIRDLPHSPHLSGAWNPDRSPALRLQGPKDHEASIRICGLECGATQVSCFAESSRSIGQGSRPVQCFLAFTADNERTSATAVGRARQGGCEAKNSARRLQKIEHCGRRFLLPPSHVNLDGGRVVERDHGYTAAKTRELEGRSCKHVNSLSRCYERGTGFVGHGRRAFALQRQPRVAAHLQHLLVHGGRLVREQ